MIFTLLNRYPHRGAILPVDRDFGKRWNTNDVDVIELQITMGNRNGLDRLIDCASPNRLNFGMAIITNHTCNRAGDRGRSRGSGYFYHIHESQVIRDLTTLNEIADTLNRAVDVQSALSTVLAKLVALLGLETGWIFLKDPSAKTQWAGRGYVLAAHHNLPPAMALHKANAWKGGCDCQGFCNRGVLTEAYNEVRCSRLAEAKGEDRPWA